MFSQPEFSRILVSEHLKVTCWQKMYKMRTNSDLIADKVEITNDVKIVLLHKRIK